MLAEGIAVTEFVVEIGEVELMRQRCGKEQLIEILPRYGIAEGRVVVARDKRGDRWGNEIVADVGVVSHAEIPVLPSAMVVAVIDELRFRMCRDQRRLVGALRRRG